MSALIFPKYALCYCRNNVTLSAQTKDPHAIPTHIATWVTIVLPFTKVQYTNPGFYDKLTHLSIATPQCYMLVHRCFLTDVVAGQDSEPAVRMCAVCSADDAHRGCYRGEDPGHVYPWPLCQAWR